jgi:D-alanine-D-alanine ligase
MSHRIRVAVIRGGPSNEHEVSLASGATVLDLLREHFDHKYDPRDVIIDQKGNWQIDGEPSAQKDIVHKFDVAFNALHGTYGEDGKIQHFFETHGIPFTGSGSLSSAIGMHKGLSKKAFAKHDIKSPYWREISSGKIAHSSESLLNELFRSMTLPVVVKPISSGSSVGVTIVRDYKDLPTALRDAAIHGDAVMIEEYIPGIEASCGVIEGFRDQDLYALPPIEIRPKTSFFDYEAKYAGQSQEIVPATFSQKIKSEIEELAKKIHHALNLRHYSRSDFIIHPRRGIYVLEVNTLPGLTGESLIPKALRAIGSDTHELIDHLIGLALDR